MATEDIIEYVETVIVPSLDRSKTEAILARSDQLATSAMRAMDRSRKASIMAGIEAEANKASSRLRDAAWKHIWNCSQAEAWKMSWVLAAFGQAVATVDIVGDNGYSMDDYAALVEPFSAGFPDFPIPRKGI